MGGHETSIDGEATNQLPILKGGNTMRCVYYTRKLSNREIVHGIRYGTTDDRTDTFLPDRDSAPVVICNVCGEKLLRLIYVKLNRPNTHPTYNTFKHT